MLHFFQTRDYSFLFLVPANAIHRIIEKSISHRLSCTRVKGCYYCYTPPIKHLIHFLLKSHFTTNAFYLHNDNSRFKIFPKTFMFGSPFLRPCERYTQNNWKVDFTQALVHQGTSLLMLPDTENAQSKRVPWQQHQVGGARRQAPDHPAKLHKPQALGFSYHYFFSYYLLIISFYVSVHDLASFFIYPSNISVSDNHQHNHNLNPLGMTMWLHILAF